MGVIKLCGPQVAGPITIYPPLPPLLNKPSIWKSVGQDTVSKPRYIAGWSSFRPIPDNAFSSVQLDKEIREQMEHYEKWIAYQNAGIKPTRYKYRAVVHSNFRPKICLSYLLDGMNVTFHPISSPENESSVFAENFMPAFECEIISEAKKISDPFSSAIMKAALDQIFAWLGCDYFLTKSFQRWEEFESNGYWFQAVSVGFLPVILSVVKEVPDIQDLLDACVVLSKKQDKRARKGILIRNKLRDALWLEKSSRNLSFLSYYSIIEIVADDLYSNKVFPSNNQSAIDFASLKLGNSQRAKIYYLLKAINNSFDLELALQLGEVRGQATHADKEISDTEFSLCREIANWAAREEILMLANNL